MIANEKPINGDLEHGWAMDPFNGYSFCMETIHLQLNAVPDLPRGIHKKGAATKLTYGKEKKCF